MTAPVGFVVLATVTIVQEVIDDHARRRPGRFHEAYFAKRIVVDRQLQQVFWRLNAISIGGAGAEGKANKSNFTLDKKRKKC